jgi:hypothetical protein
VLDIPFFVHITVTSSCIVLSNAFLSITVPTIKVIVVSILPPKESTSVIMLSLMKAPSLLKIGHHLHCSLLPLPLSRRKVIFLPHLISPFCPFLMILLLLPLFLLCSLTHHTQPPRLLPSPSLRQPPLHPLLNQTIPR